MDAKQELRNEALARVSRLRHAAGVAYWQGVEGYKDVRIAESVEQDMMAQASLLTFIDDLIEAIIEPSEYSPAVQELINRQNRELYS